MSTEAQSSEARIVAHAREAIRQNREVWHHALSEQRNDLDLIISTVVAEQPLVYAVPANMEGDGRLVCADDFAGVRAHYTAMYEIMQQTDWRPSVELRTPWYTLFEGISTHDIPGTGEAGSNHSVVFFPMDERAGILGEMPWSRVEANEETVEGSLGRTAEICRRDATRSLFYRYLGYLRAEDAAGAAACFGPVADMVCRPYPAPDDVGATKWGGDGIRQHYADLFAAYAVEAVEIVNLVAMEWYAFAELQWDVRERATGAALTFHTADILGAAKLATFQCRLGWGTRPISREG